MIKMRRTENASWIRPEEVFYDGVLPVDGDTVEIPSGKEHWELALLLRGWEVINDEPVADEPKKAEEKSATPKRKVANGKNNQ